jgi:hypothetical protein
MSRLPGASPVLYFPQNATCASQRTPLTPVNDVEPSRVFARTEAKLADALTP